MVVEGWRAGMSDFARLRAVAVTIEGLRGTGNRRRGRNGAAVAQVRR